MWPGGRLVAEPRSLRAKLDEVAVRLHDNPEAARVALIDGARVALDEWMRRYADPEEADPIALTDDLLRELA